MTEEGYPRLRFGLQAVPVDQQGQRYIVLVDPQGYSDRQVMFPMPLLFVLERLDGEHSLRDIQADVMREHDQLVPLEQLHKIVDDLDQCYLLDSPRFESLLNEMQQKYKRRAARYASHAGQAYAADPRELRDTLNEILVQGELPRALQPSRPLRAVVAPHIDYGRGQECYGYVYNAVRQFADAERFVVLGTNHSGRSGTFVATRKPFDTPLGRVPVDLDFLDQLQARYDEDLFEDELDHQREHSIELQAVWLRHVLGQRNVRMVPLLCSAVDLVAATGQSPVDNETLVDFLDALRDTLRQSDGPTCMIAAVDFSHVGQPFGDEGELTDDFLSRIARQDRRTLDAIARMDVPAFYDSIMADHNARRVCGLSALYVMLQLAEVDQFHLLQYKQCVDREAHCAVTCAAMAGF